MWGEGLGGRGKGHIWEPVIDDIKVVWLNLKPFMIEYAPVGPEGGRGVENLNEQNETESNKDNLTASIIIKNLIRTGECCAAHTPSLPYRSLSTNSDGGPFYRPPPLLGYSSLLPLMH